MIRESLRLLKEHDEVRLKWRDQIERGWLQAQAGKVVDGDEVFRKVDERVKQRVRERGCCTPLTVIAVLHGARDVEQFLKNS